MARKEQTTGHRAIDKVREAYSSDRKKMHVPEWDLDLYLGPVTVDDMEAVDARDPKTPWDRNLILLVHMAKNENGKPLFQMGDIHVLKNETPFLVLQRIIGEMLSSVVEAAEAEAELEENPTSVSD